MDLPGLVNIQKAMENGKMAIEIVDFPINSMVILHCYVTVHQRVSYHILALAMDYLGIFFGAFWLCFMD